VHGSQETEVGSLGNDHEIAVFGPARRKARTGGGTGGRCHNIEDCPVDLAAQLDIDSEDGGRSGQFVEGALTATDERPVVIDL
jgi:hypothetical protein